MQFGPVSFDAKVRVTPVGILSIGLLVSGILLSVVPIVAASTRPRRERQRQLAGHPDQNRLTGK